MAPRLLLALVVGSLLTSSGSIMAAEGSPEGLVPFVLPWDDGAAGPTDLSFLNHMPAGKFGPIQAGQDGHFYAGKERVRFLGVNLCFGGTLPEKADAEKIAARMAKFGINVVRFHHMDMHQFPDGLIRRGSSKSGELDPEALERLTHLLGALKAHGVYADINLLVSRNFRSADGLPKEIDPLDWKLRHAVGMFYAAMIELQKKYARDLLGYPGAGMTTTLAGDPAVAFVEINNENGMVQQWLGGDFDHLPKPFADELARQWNAWLKAKHQDTAGLRKAWSARSEALGQEMLNNPSGAGKLGGWMLEQHEGAVAKATIEQDVAGQSAALRIEVEKPGKAAWHVQFVHPGLKVKKGQLYAVSFTARADPPRTIVVNVGQAHEPWKILGFEPTIKLTPEWQEFKFTFEPTEADDNARLSVSGLGAETGSVWLAAVSLRTGGEIGPNPEETIEKGAIPLIQRNDARAWPGAAREEFVAFLRDTEAAYWRTMREYVKKELGFKGIVMGTIVACSPVTVQAQFDAVDGHAYWQHPDFPRRPWDAEDWTVRNVSMVNEPGGAVARLALGRVAGKPYTVTEYNHASPNTYGSEGPLLLATEAALQDWDGLFMFAYAHGREWKSGKIDGFFDIGQHPTKMANMAAAALIFRGGQVSAAKELVARGLSPQQELTLLTTRAHAWGMVDLGHLGVSAATAVLHRTAIRIAADAGGDAEAKMDETPDTKLLVSDTKEVTWDRREAGKGVVTVNAPRTKAVIGFTAGRSFELGGVTITPGQTMQDWSTISLSLLEGKSFNGPARALLVATGSAENTGMKWKDAEKTSVGRNWGQAPSVVEVVPAKIKLPVAPAKLSVWALNERGQHAGEVKVQAAPGGGSLIEIGALKTLWYEMIIK